MRLTRSQLWDPLGHHCFPVFRKWYRVIYCLDPTAILYASASHLSHLFLHSICSACGDGTHVSRITYTITIHILRIGRIVGNRESIQCTCAHSNDLCPQYVKPATGWASNHKDNEGQEAPRYVEYLIICFGLLSPKTSCSRDERWEKELRQSTTFEGDD